MEEGKIQVVTILSQKSEDEADITPTRDDVEFWREPAGDRGVGVRGMIE